LNKAAQNIKKKKLELEKRLK